MWQKISLRVLLVALLLSAVTSKNSRHAVNEEDSQDHSSNVGSVLLRLPSVASGRDLSAFLQPTHPPRPHDHHHHHHHHHEEPTKPRPPKRPPHHGYDCDDDEYDCDDHYYRRPPWHYRYPWPYHPWHPGPPAHAPTPAPTPAPAPAPPSHYGPGPYPPNYGPGPYPPNYGPAPYPPYYGYYGPPPFYNPYYRPPQYNFYNNTYYRRPPPDRDTPRLFKDLVADSEALDYDMDNEEEEE